MEVAESIEEQAHLRAVVSAFLNYNVNSYTRVG